MAAPTWLRAGGGLVLATAAAALPTSATAGRAHAAATRTVKIQDIAYSPQKLTIAKGTTVRWTFDDQIVAHTVTSTGARKFRSSTQKMSGAYTYTFRKTGTYRYYCLVHPSSPKMKGTVTVR